MDQSLSALVIAVVTFVIALVHIIVAARGGCSVQQAVVDIQGLAADIARIATTAENIQTALHIANGPEPKPARSTLVSDIIDPFKNIAS